MEADIIIMNCLEIHVPKSDQKPTGKVGYCIDSEVSDSLIRLKLNFPTWKNRFGSGWAWLLLMEIKN
jgi:hypothetical protein